MSPDANAKTILSNGEGLFQTHVQLEDVQKEIREQMNTESQLGTNTKYTVVGDGNGFMSRVILVEPEWTIKDDHLPEKFVLKITSCLHIHGLIDNMKKTMAHQFTDEEEQQMWNTFEVEAQQLHNREVNLYKILAKWNNSDVMLCPKVFFSKMFTPENKTKGFLAMEFVDKAVIRHLYVNCKPNELHPVLKSLASLQAHGLHLSDEEKQSISGFDFKTLMGQMMNDNGLAGLFEGAKKINEARLTEKAEKVEKFGLKLVNFDVACNANKYAGIEKSVLVHGDLWAANILWHEENGQYSVSKVIDYQLIHMGNPAEDLVRLFLSTMSGADTHNHWERLLDVFYEYFLEELNGEEAPYTLEQLKESYRLYYVTGGIIMLPMYGPIAQAKLAYSSTEDAEECREILTEKAEHLLDDLEKYHLYIQQKLESFENN